MKNLQKRGNTEMDDSGPTASILIFLILIFIDVFFYGFGAAISSLNEKEIERRAEEEKDKKAMRLLRIISDPAIYVNTVQLVVTLINIIMGAFYLILWRRSVTRTLNLMAEQNFAPDKIPAGVIAAAATVIPLLALLYILLTFGVLLPKKIAARVPEKWAYVCINPVFVITRALLPFTGLVTATTNGILFLFGARGNEDDNDVTEEEIIDMVNEGHEQGLIQASEAEMISNIFEFGDKEAQDIMTHRNNIAAIDGANTLEDAIAFMMEGKNSRYPVYEENIDHIIGILHLKDAMRYHREDDKLNTPIAQLSEILREPYFVPQTKNIDELFKEMRQKKLQMVIVVDEYGQTDGLVAMEDILEEIVGNIQDEYDEDKEYIEEKGNDEYIIEGKTPLEELEDRLGIQFDNDDFETLNGFLISKLDKIPEPDEEFEVECEGYRFKILSVENKMIARVLVTRRQEADIGEPEESGKPQESVLEEI